MAKSSSGFIFTPDFRIKRNLLSDFKSDTKKEKQKNIKNKWILSNSFVDKLDDYIGQSKVKNAIEIAIVAAYKQNKALDHMLFYGPPGFGKTKMSELIVNILKIPVIHFTGKTISKSSEFNRFIHFIKNACPFGIVFIDEIHRITKSTSEELYGIMQDFEYRDETIPTFTLLGATTDAGLVVKPLRDRFKYSFKFDKYEKEHLSKILQQKDSKLSKDVIDFLVERCKGTPRILLGYYNQALNVSIYEDKERPDITHCMYAMDLIGVDESGLTPSDIELLSYLRDVAKPVGKSTLAAALNVSESDLTQITETWLLQQRLISRTARGREITNNGINLLREKGM